MHWGDFFILGLIIGGTYLGTFRGMILELTDWVMVLAAATTGYRCYEWLGTALKGSFLRGWSDSWIYGFSWLFFALPTFILFLSLGLHLDRVTKEQDRIPPEVRKYAGGAVALLKYIVLSGIWIGYMNVSDLMTPGETAQFRRASIVTALRNMNPAGVMMIRIAAPPDKAAKFIEAMNRT